MPKTPTDVRQLAEKDDVKIVDVKFIDLPGVWQHFSFPVEDLTDDIFEDGLEDVVLEDVVREVLDGRHLRGRSRI